MHLHASGARSQGPPPRQICAPFERFPLRDPREGAKSLDDSGQQFEGLTKNDLCETTLLSPADNDEMMERTLTLLEKYNITAVTSGPLVDKWRDAGGQRIIPAYGFFDPAYMPPLPQIKKWLTQGRFRAIAEIGWQYAGLAPDASVLAPYFELAEELDVPMGIHMGPGPPGAPYVGFYKYRAALSSPLLLEDVLIRHPKVRVWIMHAGYPLLDDTIALLYTHPHVYVDTGIIGFFNAPPRLLSLSARPDRSWIRRSHHVRI